MRLPSPATAISLVALTVALGGTSYAVTVGSPQVRNNSLTSADVKNRTLRSIDVRRNALTGGNVRNRSLSGADLRDLSVLGADLGPLAVTGDKIAANAIDGSKIVDGGVSGADVDEGSLASVPNAANAANAANADTLDGQDSAAFERADRTIRLGLVRFTEGQTPQLAQIGPFTFTGACDLDNGGNDQSRIDITTSEQDGALYASENDPDFDSGTLIFAQSSDTADTPTFLVEDRATAISADGTTIVHGTEVFAGANTLGADCVVGGTLTLG